jgi:plastocyanin
MTALLRRLSRRPRALLGPLAVLVLAALAGFAMRAAARPEPRTVVLTARDMAFWTEDSSTPNPAIAAAPGEALRLELRNRDRGMAHDLALPGLGRATPVLAGAGESAALELRAPDEPGDYEYVCSLHSRLMRGLLTVR